MKFLRATAHAVFFVVLYFTELLSARLILGNGRRRKRREKRKRADAVTNPGELRVFNCVCVSKAYFFLAECAIHLSFARDGLKAFSPIRLDCCCCWGCPAVLSLFFQPPVTFLFFNGWTFFGVCVIMRTRRNELQQLRGESLLIGDVVWPNFGQPTRQTLHTLNDDPLLNNPKSC